MRDAAIKAANLQTIHQLHGFIGGKNSIFINLKEESITSSEHFLTLWLNGLKRELNRTRSPSRFHDLATLLKENRIFKEYTSIFLRRTYLDNYEAYSRNKPLLHNSEIWIGQNNAEYGLLITPRFNDNNWKNDKSEIRHFPEEYWTIGHILNTGLAIPYKNKRITFPSTIDYLNFFTDIIVRHSGSKYEMDIAEQYANYVTNHKDPTKIPILIPELRYNGLTKNHKYRLDFCILNQSNLTKTGFELSPWSTHGYISNTGKMTAKEINEAAKNNFEREIKKHKDYFMEYGIFTLIYTDCDLQDCTKIFKDILKHLEPKNQSAASYSIIDEFFGEK